MEPPVKLVSTILVLCIICAESSGGRRISVLFLSETDESSPKAHSKGERRRQRRQAHFVMNAASGVGGASTPLDLLHIVFRQEEPRIFTFMKTRTRQLLLCFSSRIEGSPVGGIDPPALLLPAQCLPSSAPTRSNPIESSQERGVHNIIHTRALMLFGKSAGLVAGMVAARSWWKGERWGSSSPLLICR